MFSKPAGLEQIKGWETSWFIFAGYALVVAILFMLIFHDKKAGKAVSASVDEADPEGMVEV